MPFRATSLCCSDSGAGCAGTGGRYFAAGANGANRTGADCNRSLLDGFLSHELSILIPMTDSTLVLKGGAVCGNSARTDLRGGRLAMAVPTATPAEVLRVGC